MELETAGAAGEAVAGAALGWRNAFDNVPLSHVEAALSRARVPGWVAGPIMAAYGAERRLRVDQAVGDAWSPTRGILPGCALAVFVLRLLLEPWDAAVDRRDSDVSRR
eukprot:10123975-Lingulodinium_polyedra.AAC.1